MMSGIISGVLLAIAVYVLFRFLVLKGLKRCLIGFLESDSFKTRVDSLIKQQIQSTFNKVTVKIPFAAPFLTSEFVKNLEKDTLDEAAPKVKEAILDHYDELAKGLLTYLWPVTIGAFLLGFLLVFCVKIIEQF